MKRFYFSKLLGGGLQLINVSTKDIDFTANTILTEDQLKDYKADVYFVCKVKNGSYLKTQKKVKTGKAFLKFYNENK